MYCWWRFAWWTQGKQKKKITDKYLLIKIPSVIQLQYSSVTQLCVTLCDPMNRSTPGLPVHHQLPDFTQTHWVGDAIQPSHPLSSPSPALNLSQHQRLFQRVSSSHQVGKVLKFQLQRQSFQWTPRTDLLLDGLVQSPCSPRDSPESSPTPQFKSINSSVLSFLYSPTLTSIQDSLSLVQFFATPQAVARQASLSMGFSRQESWSGLPFASPGDFPDPGIEPGSPALQGDSLPSEPPGKLQWSSAWETVTMSLMAWNWLFSSQIHESDSIPGASPKKVKQGKGKQWDPWLGTDQPPLWFQFGLIRITSGTLHDI